ncbi:hypothetical protein BJ508DRAFT_415907 [Ascobolus immersus RN42]|uniref:Uncharacterized protein n=1 Tax=Ascobolus immersus RN42 TaxID=1160509 RepID=A0A3N4I1Y4_ASCIM|nr:hypothetical protein BJ508DRAFT_415907 [Ascobolus immersus RN42]
MSEEKHQATIKQKQDADDQESLIRLEEGLAYIRDLNWAESLLLTCQNPVSPSGRIPQSDCKDLEDGLDELKAFHCPWPDPRSPDQDKALSELYEKLCHDLFTNGEAEICQPNCKKVTKEDIEEAIQQAKEAKNEERFEDFKAMLAYVEATMHAESLLNLCLQPEEIQESFLGPRWQWGSCAYFQDSLNAAKAIYDPLYRFHSPAASTETSDP